MSGQKSEQQIEATLQAICHFWAEHFEGDFSPDDSPHDLAPDLLRRFDDDMQTLWTYTESPFRFASEANLRANPRLYGAFDSYPVYRD